MEEKKKIKLSLKSFIFIIIATIFIGIAIGSLTIKIINNKKIEEKNISENLDVKVNKGEEYYIIKEEYEGEYDLQFISLSQYYNSENNVIESFEKKEVMDYEQYRLYCQEWELNKVYSEQSKNYIVFSYAAMHSPNLDARLADIKYIGNNVDIYIWDDASGVTADISAYCLVIPTEKEIDNINIIRTYTDDEFKNIKRYNSTSNPDYMKTDKPVIYLYPTIETETSVKLLNEDKITCSYPKYNDEWKVLAKPSGDLIDLNTGRNLYTLYYESKMVVDMKVINEGFVIKGEECAKFLEEKLEVLGLNEREAEEFIIYWLPKLESNKYNYIRFATEEEINQNMPLEINPSPDTIIRVLMTFKGLKEPIEVEEQKLVTPERKGFTVVEWGGTEIK